MKETYLDVVTAFPPKQTHEGGAVLLHFQTRDGNTLRISMRAQVARYLASQLQLHLQLLTSQALDIGQTGNEPDRDTVDIVPPDKSPDGETVLLKFQIANEDTVRLRMPADVAQQFGSQLLQLPVISGNR